MVGRGLRVPWILRCSASCGAPDLLLSVVMADHGRAGWPRSSPRWPGLFHEFVERDAEGVGDADEVAEPGVAFGAFVALDAAAFHADGVGELVLGEAGGSS